MVAFWCYDPSDDGSRGFNAWRARLPLYYRARMDTTLRLLVPNGAFARALADEDTVKPLKGRRCAGLIQIKVDFAVYAPQGELLPRRKKHKRKKRRPEIHIRILCFRWPGRDDVTLLHGFLKKGEPDYGPACRTAFNKMRGVQKYEGTAKRSVVWD